MLTVTADEQSALWSVDATQPRYPPSSVAFAVDRGNGWQRLAVDPEPPYRAFLDPAKFKPGARVHLVAVARSLDSRTATSKVVTFRVASR